LNKQILLLSEAKQELSTVKGQLTGAVVELLTASENLTALDRDLMESRNLQSQALESLKELENLQFWNSVKWATIGVGSGLVLGVVIDRMFFR